MKKNSLLSFLTVSILFISVVNAQQDTQQHYVGEVLIGLGVNMIDDNGTFDLGKNISFTNPYVLSTEYTFHDNFSVIGILSFNKYVEGEIIDGQAILEGNEANYVAFDFSSRYYLREVLNEYEFEPYLSLGLGYTHIGKHKVTGPVAIPGVGRMTLNPGLGLNVWLSPAFGLNANYMGKIGIKAGENKSYISNQSQISFGMYYSINKKYHRRR